MEFLQSLDAKSIALIIGAVLGASFFTFKLVKTRNVTQDNNTIHGDGDIVAGNKTVKQPKK